MSSDKTNPVISATKLVESVKELLSNGNLDPETLLRYLRPVIASPETYVDVLDQPARQAKFLFRYDSQLWVPDWEQFYREVYGLKDLNLVLTFKHPCRCIEYTWPVFCDPRVGLNRTWAVTQDLFRTHNHIGEDLEAVVTKNDRSAVTNGLYMVRFRAHVEADERHGGLSANVLTKRVIHGITLDERLKLDQFVCWKMRGFCHLDQFMTTLCTGSRRHDGSVPSVDGRGNQVHLACWDPDLCDEHLRTRSIAPCD